MQDKSVIVTGAFGTQRVSNDALRPVAARPEG